VEAPRNETGEMDMSLITTDMVLAKMAELL